MPWKLFVVEKCCWKHHKTTVSWSMTNRWLFLGKTNSRSWSLPTKTVHSLFYVGFWTLYSNWRPCMIIEYQQLIKTCTGNLQSSSQELMIDLWVLSWKIVSSLNEVCWKPVDMMHALLYIICVDIVSLPSEQLLNTHTEFLNPGLSKMWGRVGVSWDNLTQPASVYIMLD